MGKVKVYAPNEGYGDRVGEVQFEKGVAEVDDTTDAGKSFLRYAERKGYGIGSKPKAAGVSSDKVEPTLDGKVVDARDYAERQMVGSPLRDAAVDPKPGDFLPPTNAGKANPHGPKVVAPGIHAEGPAGIRAGEVHVDDVDEQERAETALATAALIEGEPATERQVNAHAGELTKSGELEGGNMGPLGLSDPGSVDMGVEAAKAVRAAESEGSSMPTAAPARTTRTSTRRASGPKSASK